MGFFTVKFLHFQNQFYVLNSNELIKNLNIQRMENKSGRLLHEYKIYTLQILFFNWV